ncbi:hypothetical protein [Microbispora rosea]|uniref:hypothetical protein n=1 Tax=Microbispora rosea TaxID=58117 RepID=UPI0009708F17|nr:hypothetical protein [Microbispora rosea]GIH46122.1 hypothetical protein Mro03_13010 [Microbispora rosea subsp. rosea]
MTSDLTEQAVAACIAKYATEAAECVGTLDRRIVNTEDLTALPIRDHARRLITLSRAFPRHPMARPNEGGPRQSIAPTTYAEIRSERSSRRQVATSAGLSGARAVRARTGRRAAGGALAD